MESTVLERFLNRRLHLFSVAIDLIFFKLASHKHLYTILEGFEFRSDQTTYCGVSCP